MICKLCLKQKNLVNSHIIPEFLYKPLYSPVKGHKNVKRFYVITTDSKEKVTFEQIGFREKLLCSDCDNKIIGSYEKYASKVLKTFKYKIRSESFRLRKITISDIDYKKFKLFQLSILWRTSITSLKYFINIELGTFHNEILRKMILNGDPGKPEDYGCQLQLTTGKNKTIRKLILTNMILPPVKPSIINGHTVYKLFFGGLWWLFFINNPSFPINKELFLSTSGNIPVFKDKKFSVNFLLEYFSDVAESDNFQKLIEQLKKGK